MRVPDIPAHTYQLTFEPNLEWPEFYAKSTDIYKYWKKVAEKYDCNKYIKLQHQVVEARWIADESKWHVLVSEVIVTASLGDLLIYRGGKRSHHRRGI